MLVILLFFSLFYYLHYIFRFYHKFDLKKLLTLTYQEGMEYHLWFLYMYLAFLVSLPFLRAMVKNLENKYFIYLFLIALIMGSVLPVTEYLLFHGSLTLNSNARVGWLTNYEIFYPCLG